MKRTDDLNVLPDGLPVPVDDGACDYLIGSIVPSITLASTVGGTVDVSQRSGRIVIYIYPRTGDPAKASVPGWEEIPGAWGCTPQTCSFCDHYQDILSLGADVFGLSAQTPEAQQEMVGRLHVPFAVLSDEKLLLSRALKLSTFEVQTYNKETLVLIKRLTLIIKDGVIERVFYPVFPPNQNPDDVIAWFKNSA
jgi:peroxiredoxin